MNISGNLSSIQAHQTLMDNNANNIANANTDGYIPKRGTLSEEGDGGVKADLAPATDNGSSLSQTDLNKELSDQIVIETATEANVKAIQSKDAMFGSLLDIKV